MVIHLRRRRRTRQIGIYRRITHGNPVRRDCTNFSDELTEQERREQEAFLDTLVYAEYMPMATLDIVLTAMEPYFQDQRPYEACLAELQSQLELYIRE